MMLMSLSNEKIEFTCFEVYDFIQKVKKVEDIILKENKLDLDVEKAFIRGDKELLEVVIRNLVENSNKAEPKDNKILIKGRILENKKYRVSVIDKGNGIPKEHLTRVTEDFYMVDKSRSAQNNGSGIGLSLVKKILNLHDSDIHIQSKVNSGTVAYFDLEVE